jgi:hypothetical protein
MLIKFKNLVLIVCQMLLVQVPIKCQTPNIEWQKCYGGTNTENSRGLLPISTGGTLLLGRSYSSNGTLMANYGGADAWVVKVNDSGNVVWQKNYGGTNLELFEMALETQDGGFLLAGETQSNNGIVVGNDGGQDLWVVKIDSIGNIEWQKCLGGTSIETGSKIVRNNNNGYLVFGHADSNNGDLAGIKPIRGLDWWVVNLTATGNILWSKIYGGSNSESASDFIQCLDGNYILTGSSSSIDGNVSNGWNGAGSITIGWVVKIDTLGNIIWEKSYGSRQLNTSYDEGFTSVQNTADGGCILAGYVSANGSIVTGHHGGYDFWVVKLDSLGNFQWQQCYGGSANDRPYAIKPTQDGGWILIGETTSSDFDVTNFKGVADVWLVKISSTGVLEWQKCLGGNNGERGTDIYQSQDGGFMAIGNTNSSNNGNVGFNNGGVDIWLVKLSQATTVPIKLAQYQARALGSTAVLNTWQTAQEINSSHFVVERSTDGRNFVSVGRLEAATNSMVMRNYRFTDQTVDFNANAIYYYRLKMVDLDGSASYSQIEKVTNNSSPSLIIFPNPVAEVLNIQLYAQQQETTILHIYDLKGAIILHKQINIAKGNNFLKQDVSNLPKGTYYVVIQGSRVWKSGFMR